MSMRRIAGAIAPPEGQRVGRRVQVDRMLDAQPTLDETLPAVIDVRRDGGGKVLVRDRCHNFVGAAHEGDGLVSSASTW